MSFFSRPWRRSSRRASSIVNTRLAIERLEDRQLLSASAGQFITGLYYDLLHRSPSQSEVTAWTGLLKAGLSPHDVAKGFATSPEYRYDLIQHDYETLLGREPDAASTVAWSRAMQRGMAEPG